MCRPVAFYPTTLFSSNIFNVLLIILGGFANCWSERFKILQIWNSVWEWLFIQRTFFPLSHTGVKENVLLFSNPTIILFSFLSLRGATRKIAVLVDRCSKAFTMTSMYSTERYFYNSLLFRTNDIRKEYLSQSLSYSWSPAKQISST